MYDSRDCQHFIVNESSFRSTTKARGTNCIIWLPCPALRKKEKGKGSNLIMHERLMISKHILSQPYEYDTYPVFGTFY